MPREAIKPCPCDITALSLSAAARQLGAEPSYVRVHPHDLSLARRCVYELGWRCTIVEIDPTFEEDEWALVDGADHMIHSAGV